MHGVVDVGPRECARAQLFIYFPREETVAVSLCHVCRTAVACRVVGARWWKKASVGVGTDLTAKAECVLGTAAMRTLVLPNSKRLNLWCKDYGRQCIAQCSHTVCCCSIWFPLLCCRSKAGTGNMASAVAFRGAVALMSMARAACASFCGGCPRYQRPHTHVPVCV